MELSRLHKLSRLNVLDPGCFNLIMSCSLMKRVVLLGLVCVIGSCAPVEQGAVEEAEPETAVVEQLEVEAEETIYVPAMAKSFEEQWPVRFSRNEVINSAQSKTFPFFEQGLQRECEYHANFYWQETHNLREEIEDIAESLITVFCSDITADIPVIVGDYDFLKQTLLEQQLKTDDFGGICGNERVPQSMAGCALFGTGWFRGDVSDALLRRLVAHELFHLVQDGISPEPESTRTPPGHPQKVPNWLTEGSAMFFEATFNDFVGEDKGWEYLKYAQTDSTIRPNSKNQIDLEILEDDFSSRTYNVGQFVSEYLVANSSFDSLMNIWRFRDEGYSFDDAFMASFGISSQDFYSVVSQIQVLPEE